MEHNLHDATKYFLVGLIAGTHALKGEVRVFPQTSDRGRFTKGLELFYEGVRGEQFPLTVEASRQNGKFVLVKFKALDSINDVERFRGGKLYVDRKDAIPLEDGEYFVADLVGMEVFTDDGTRLGELTDVLETGANDVYVVRLFPEEDGEAEEKSGKQKEVLIPAVPDCVRDVRVEEKRMTVHLLDGML